MKKMFAVIFMMAFFGLNSQAQKIIREGNTFSVVSNNSAKSDTLMTGFRWKDSKGLLYPIIVNKSSGACYVWKKSSKTSRMYRQYLKPEVCIEVCKALGITYKPKSVKK